MASAQLEKRNAGGSGAPKRNGRTRGAGARRFGVAIADRHGELIAADRGFTELLEPPRDAAIGSTCCEILGCRRVGSGLEHICVTELTLAGAPVRKARTEAPHHDDREVLVTTSMFSSDESLVLIEVLPVEGDRQTRELAVFTLGRTLIEDEGGSLGGEWLEQRPARLLKYLVAERHRVVAADEIAEALWQDAQPQTLNGVRQCVHALRHRLEPERPPRAASSYVSAHRGGYALERDSVWIDADHFEALVANGMALYEAGNHELAAEQLKQATSLYRGDFLADEPYAEWALAERNRLATVASKTLRVLSAIHLRARDYDAATRALERLAGLDSYDVNVQRELIRLCIARGRLSEAKRRYAMFRSRLMRDFGQRPDFGLADVAQTREFSVERLLA